MQAQQTNHASMYPRGKGKDGDDEEVKKYQSGASGSCWAGHLLQK